MKADKKMLLYLIPIFIAFYILPLFIYYDKSMAVINVICIIPLICFITTIIYAFNKVSSIMFPIISIILYIPTIFIYYGYNSGAGIYIVIYGVIIFLGYIIGKLLNKFIKHLKNKMEVK